MWRTLMLPDGRGAVVRPAVPEDAESLTAIDAALALDGRGMVLTPAQVRTPDEQRDDIAQLQREAAAGSASLQVVAEFVGGGRRRVVGAATLRQLRPALCAHVGVLSVGVHPDAQGLHLGRALMEALIDRGRESRLERLELYVRHDNERARALYRSLGFEHEGTRRQFVKTPDGRYVDDHIMVLFLAAPS